ncbi:MAG: SMC-Scp complex subunit ScpB [bacterium]|nr:SMC-Scp complex subunit ScpB [bacterium]
MNLDAKLEALLFWKGEPMSKKKAEATLSCTREELEMALTALDANFVTRGIRVMREGDDIELRTAPEASEMIEKLTKDELMRDLGKAGLETLAIILYQGPVRRADIDYIRGVNSSFILRNLLVRGLVERVTEKDTSKDGVSGQGSGRGFSYKPTMELLAHLGVAKVEDLPDFAKVKTDLAAFEAEQNAAYNNES